MRLSDRREVVVGFEDGQISILRLNISYTGSDSSSFDEVRKFSTGVSLSSIGVIPSSWNQKNFFLLGCRDGFMRLFDIANSKVVAELFSSKGQLVDNVILRENSQCAFSIVFCGEQDMNLNVFHVAESSTSQIIIQDGLLTTISESVCAIPGSSKFQLIPSFDPARDAPTIIMLSSSLKYLLVIQL